MTIQLYGIPNCDTVRKARKWLEAKGIDYAFHDFKKEGVERARLDRWIEAVSWETLLNRRGTTFRKLPDAEKGDLDAGKAAAIMEAHNSAIKRPVVEHADQVMVGFDEDRWASVLG